MNEVFSIQVHNRQFLEQGKQGVWLDLPTTTETLQAALRDVGITADNPQDFFINGYSCPEDRHLAIPYDMVLAADVDELNFLAARLGQLDAAEIAELNAALQNPRGGFENIGQIIDYTENVDYYVHLPDVRGDGQLGDYYLNRSGMVDMPEEWKAGIDTAQFGRHIAQQGLLDKIRSTGMGGISADDPQAVSKLEKKLEKLEASQELMKAVNAYYRKHGTLDGCPHLTERGIENLKADMASGWHYEKKPFQSWQLSNNNAEIRRLKGRIEELTRQKEAAYVGWEFDGGTVEINRVANRLQIFFEGKPDAAVRDELKSNGFRWSPKAGAWQRQLNDTTIRVADRIKCIQPLSGEKPSALQLAARREKEKPSIRAQLNAAKTEQAKQPPAREKSKGLEVE